MIFDLKSGELVTYAQESTEILHRENDWAEQDANELYDSTVRCINTAVDKLQEAGIPVSCVKAIGITNQRETTIAWNKLTGEPLYNAILWLDSRTKDLVEKFTQKANGKNPFAFQRICGLPISTYFSALKMRWLLDECPNVQAAAREHNLMMGTVDSWLLWRLTCGQVFATDVSNASRYMLMNLHRMQWDMELCKFFRLDSGMLPEIRSSSELYGRVMDVNCRLQGVAITAVLGDQQAALLGHNCTNPGETKTTYGTGCFILCNTGTDLVFSKKGILTTVAYQLGGSSQPVTYALEGSIACGGSTIKFLRDNLKFFSHVDELDELLEPVRFLSDEDACRQLPYFVPAFAGLLCPYWDPNARACLIGMDFTTTRAHILRAALEAIAFQNREILDAMKADYFEWEKDRRRTLSGDERWRTKSHSQIIGESEVVSVYDDCTHSSTDRHFCSVLRVDGAMANNDCFLQWQADLSGISVERPTTRENTALGIAIAAALGAGLDASKLRIRVTEMFYSQLNENQRDKRFLLWKRAVMRSLNWTSSHQMSLEELSVFQQKKCLLTTEDGTSVGGLPWNCGRLIPMLSLSIGVGIAIWLYKYRIRFLLS